MNSLIRNLWLAIGLAASIVGFTPSSFGDVAPAGGASAISPNRENIGPVNAGPTGAGLDGNLRLVFNVLDPANGAVMSANMWIVGPTGNLLAVTPSLPIAAQGENTTPTYTTALVQGQADGNTTVAFLFPSTTIVPTTLNVWTLNPAGQLIAAASYGPFAGFQIEDADWQQSTGKLLVKWSSTGAPPKSYSVWTVNEFGGVDTAFGPVGFTGTVLSKAVLLKNGNVDLVWDTTVTPTTHTTGLWVVSPTGLLIAAGAAGPF